MPRKRLRTPLIVTAASRMICFALFALTLGWHGAARSEAEPNVPFRHALGLENQAMCAECHGQWAEGTDQGPTLIHGYYVSSHHSDQAFYRAILMGSPIHHWDFGDIPPVPRATAPDAENTTNFVRWLQQYKSLY